MAISGHDVTPDLGSWAANASPSIRRGSCIVRHIVSTYIRCPKQQPDARVVHVARCAVVCAAPSSDPMTCAPQSRRRRSLGLRDTGTRL